MLLINSHETKKVERPLIRLYSEKNLTMFKNALENINWASVHNSTNVNESYSKFADIITQTYNKCFKLTKLSRKRTKDKPWITSALKKSSQVKNTLYKKWIKTRNPNDEIKYKDYKRIFSRIAHETEIIYYKELFDAKTNSAKTLWTNLNKICSFKKKQSKLEQYSKHANK